MKAKIVIDPKIMGGKPVIAGTRIPAYLILDLLAEGISTEKILKDYYPQLTHASIKAVAKYAAHVIEGEEIHFVEKKRDVVYEANI